MDQNTLVDEQITGGEQLIKLLVDKGVDVKAAFWAKPTDERRWLLYLALSIVDKQGSRSGYREVLTVVRAHPELWLDASEIKVLGESDSLTSAALAIVNRNPIMGPFSDPDVKSYRGMTRYFGSYLSDLSIDGALIYPPLTIITST